MARPKYSQIVARLQWDPAAIDLTADARAWPGLPEARRRRLTTLLAGFRVAEDAVAENLTPFVVAANRETLASQESLMAWTFSLQRRDEARHARLFDRIAALEKSILRVALYELRYREDVPAEVAIDEAVNLAKRYCGADAPGFVNGILGTAARAKSA